MEQLLIHLIYQLLLALVLQCLSSSKYAVQSYKNGSAVSVEQDNLLNLYKHTDNDKYWHNLMYSFPKVRHPTNRNYTNDFVVHIRAPREVADELANRHGFSNIGQIGSIPDHYLFRHQRLAKRSKRACASSHHAALQAEPQIKWLQQQHEKVRSKRDLYEPQQKYHSYPFSFYNNGIPTDPLFKDQWYLYGGANGGLDMNVLAAWKKGYTGKGVVVTILDDGIQRNHPDLAENYDPGASYDINDNDSDPMPRDDNRNKHGTRCAGEVAAVAFNKYCGVGIAYNARIGGVRMLDGTVNDAVEAQAISLNSTHIDIYSASWGPEDDGATVDGPGPVARTAFIHGVTSGRKGKGSIFVWASGNGGRFFDSCNCDGYTNSIFTLSISSATQAGLKPWYLEECSSTLTTTYSSGSPAVDRSIATVDMDGRLRPEHICTAEHTGTSASAPLAAGICALALEANPELTWRDMQYLVLMTSRPEPLEREPGWAVNGVNRRFNHKFGYGLMDAGAMISLAERWTTVPTQHICKSSENNARLKIASAYGSIFKTHTITNACKGTPNEVRYLEHVQCRVTMENHPRGNIRLRLTSPMGTTSTLLAVRPRDLTKSSLDEWPFLSVHFWGESAQGEWTLEVANLGERNTKQTGQLTKWQLIFYGTATQPVRLKELPKHNDPLFEQYAAAGAAARAQLGQNVDEIQYATTHNKRSSYYSKTKQQTLAKRNGPFL